MNCHVHVFFPSLSRSSDGTVEAIECLQAMVSGLYTEAFGAVIYLINR